jgi:glycosyltransferase involved in cell wall biosynthesis
MQNWIESTNSIDVVIPVFNGQDYILQALHSVEQQSYVPHKIIVVDDGSTDKTPELVQGYASHVSVEYVRQANKGLSSARNTGIARCTSQYVAFLDADDEWMPNKLAEQVRIFDNSDFGNLGVVYSKYCIIDSDGKLTRRHYVFEPEPSIRGNIYTRLFEANKIAGSGSGVLIKRGCFDHVGLFDETLHACEDWDMWLRLASRYEFDFVPEVLVKIRRHKNSIQQNTLLMFRNQLLFYNKWLPVAMQHPDCLSALRLNVASYLISHLPSVRYISRANTILLSSSKEILFFNFNHSLSAFLLSMFPAVALKLLKRYMQNIRRYLGMSPRI